MWGQLRPRSHPSRSRRGGRRPGRSVRGRCRRCAAGASASPRARVVVMSIIALRAGRRTIEACEGVSGTAATASAQISFWSATERACSACAAARPDSENARYVGDPRVRVPPERVPEFRLGRGRQEVEAQPRGPDVVGLLDDLGAPPVEPIRGAENVNARRRPRSPNATVSTVPRPAGWTASRRTPAARRAGRPRGTRGPRERRQREARRRGRASACRAG